MNEMQLEIKAISNGQEVVVASRFLDSISIQKAIEEVSSDFIKAYYGRNQ